MVKFNLGKIKESESDSYNFEQTLRICLRFFSDFFGAEYIPHMEQRLMETPYIFASRYEKFGGIDDKIRDILKTLIVKEFLQEIDVEFDEPEPFIFLMRQMQFPLIRDRVQQSSLDPTKRLLLKKYLNMSSASDDELYAYLKKSNNLEKLIADFKKYNEIFTEKYEQIYGNTDLISFNNDCNTNELRKVIVKIYCLDKLGYSQVFEEDNEENLLDLLYTFAMKKEDFFTMDEKQKFAEFFNKHFSTKLTFDEIMQSANGQKISDFKQSASDVLTRAERLTYDARREWSYAVDDVRNRLLKLASQKKYTFHEIREMFDTIDIYVNGADEMADTEAFVLILDEAEKDICLLPTKSGTHIKVHELLHIASSYGATDESYRKTGIELGLKLNNINEVLTDFYAVAITCKMASKGVSLGEGSIKSYYAECFSLFDKFFMTYNPLLKKCFMGSTVQPLLDKLGKENLESLDKTCGEIIKFSRNYKNSAELIRLAKKKIYDNQNVDDEIDPDETTIFKKLCGLVEGVYKLLEEIKQHARNVEI